MRRVLFAAVGLMLSMTGACSPPPELTRPAAPPEASARSLLPPGRVESVSIAGSIDGARATAPDGTLTALRYANPDAARTAFDVLAQRMESRSGITNRSRVSVGALQYLRYSGGDAAGLIWLSQTWLFAAEAQNAERVAALIAASKAGGVEDTGQLFMLLAIVGAAIVIGLVVLILLLRRYLRSQIVAPAPGVAPVPRAALIERLMGLNDPSRPWQVRTGPEADLVVEWKVADAAWWGVMAKQGVRETYRLRLYLDEAAHRVGALDESSEVEWSAGLMSAPTFRLQKTAFRGVQLFKRKRQVAYGFDTPAGGGFGKKLDVDFDLDALKQPVVAAVTAAGWSYAPVARPQ
ncbi:MAG: hypothetical protein FJX62_12310 [Alphaproteobacteria bacterium]|nr:hypothetical protein [Alphaproteobacteria bacterium]